MKISKLIERLRQIQDEEGDLEVTCTGSTLPDGHGGSIPDVFETTVENVEHQCDEKMGRRVRIFM